MAVSTGCSRLVLGSSCCVWKMRHNAYCQTATLDLNEPESLLACFRVETGEVCVGCDQWPLGTGSFVVGWWHDMDMAHTVPSTLPLAGLLGRMHREGLRRVGRLPSNRANRHTTTGRKVLQA